MLTTIALVRHGETNWNLEARIQGQTDILLNDQGRKQAKALSAHLKLQAWDAVISSDLSRARETAEIIAHEAGIAIFREDVRLRERNFGKLEGTTTNERITKWGERWKSLDLGVESDESVRSRAGKLIDDVADEFRGRRVVIVSHGGVLRQLFNSKFSMQYFDQIYNTSLSIFRKNGEIWESILFNCNTHLEL